MKNILNQNILVTGGCGFIGGHLVEELVAQGVNATVVDILVDPQSYFETNNLRKKVNLELVDIRNKDKVFNLFEKIEPSYVIHLAAEPLVEEAYKDPYTTFEINVMGTVNILEAARMQGSVKGIIVASSDKAYGKSDQAYNENHPLKGDHPYDVSKSCEDLIALAYHKTYGLPVVVTRFANVYGEGDLNFRRIIPDICETVIKKSKLLLRSDGTHARDYIYVKDVVNGYMFLLENFEKVNGQAFNFGSDDNLAVIDLVKLAEEVLETKIEIEIINNAKNEIPYQHLDYTRVKSLGWKPQFTLKNTLKTTLGWYKQMNIDIPPVKC